MKRWVVADPGGKVKEDSEAGFQKRQGVDVTFTGE